MAVKCPLCGGKTVNSECVSCGYRLPDESDISSLYNYDPSDYPQENPSMPETGYAYAEPEDVNTPEFKVRENPYAENNAGANNNAGNPYANNNGNPYANNNGNFTPYQSPNNNGGNQQQPYQNPYANGNFKPYTSNGSSGDFGSFFKQYWWLLLLSFFVPIVGLIFFMTSKDKIDKSFHNIIIIAIVLGFILPP